MAGLRFVKSKLSSIKGDLTAFKSNVAGNQAKIENSRKNETDMKKVRDYFTGSRKIYVVDFADGNVLLDNDLKQITARNPVQRTAKFKFFPKLGIITPVFGVLARLKECQGWSGAEMKEAMYKASTSAAYRIPVQLTEDTQIYSYLYSCAKNDSIEDEFDALTKD